MAKKKKEPEMEPFNKLIEWPPEKIREYLTENREHITSSYSSEELTAFWARVFDSLYTDDVKPNANRRQVWTVNHGNIMLAITKSLEENGAMPSVVQIAEELKLSRVTVTRHLKYFERDEYLSVHRQKWKIATERVLLKLSQYVFSRYTNATESTRAAAVYLKFADKFLHPVDSKPDTGATNNFIQINNVYINQTTIQSLPEEKRRLIESIILNSEINGQLERGDGGGHPEDEQRMERHHGGGEPAAGGWMEHGGGPMGDGGTMATGDGWMAANIGGMESAHGMEHGNGTVGAGYSRLIPV